MKDKKQKFNSLQRKIKKIANSSYDKDLKLKTICKLLKDNVPYYDWVGFYFVDESKKELFLGPFEGEQTEHIKIKFGNGICGQTVEKKETFVAQDVSKEKNYLSCSIKVKSEIVVPVFKNGKIIGELDIDSHKISPFDEEDRKFLEKVCKILSKDF